MDDEGYDLETQPPGLLTWRDQTTVAGLTIVCLLLIAGCWAYRGGLQGRLIDIDRAPPRPIEFKLDVNRADWPEWTVLPGVGEVLAKRIVESREADGPFKSHGDLLRVHGIGPRTLERIMPYLLPIEEAGDVATGQGPQL